MTQYFICNWLFYLPVINGTKLMFALFTAFYLPYICRIFAVYWLTLYALYFREDLVLQFKINTYIFNFILTLFQFKFYFGNFSGSLPNTTLSLRFKFSVRSWRCCCDREIYWYHFDRLLTPVLFCSTTKPRRTIQLQNYIMRLINNRPIVHLIPIQYSIITI